MTVRIGDVRAEDGGIKEFARGLLGLVKLELFSRILEHSLKERCSRTAACAIKYQNPFSPLPAIPSAIHCVTPERWDRDSLLPQPRIRGDEPLDRVFEAFTRMSSIQKPRGSRVTRILNGLASPWPTSLDQTLFERFRQNLAEIDVGLGSQENPGELYGQCGVLELVGSSES